MLLYLCESFSFTATSSAFAILTEVVGKVYSVNLILNKTSVKSRIRRNA
jgi:hypothetical protein